MKSSRLIRYKAPDLRNRASTAVAPEIVENQRFEDPPPSLLSACEASIEIRTFTTIDDWAFPILGNSYFASRHRGASAIHSMRPIHPPFRITEMPSGSEKAFG